VIVTALCATAKTFSAPSFFASGASSTKSRQHARSKTRTTFQHQRLSSCLEVSHYDSLTSGDDRNESGILHLCFVERICRHDNWLWSSPPTLSDGPERCCYQAVVVAAAIIMFQRIAFAQDVVTLVQEYYGTLQEFTVFQLRSAEWLCLLAVLAGSICYHWVSNIPWKPTGGTFWY
jgi:hypothetical protein